MKQILMDNGIILPDVIANNIINAANRGLMTDRGRKLWILPDTRYGPPNASGFRMMRPVKKKDALRLEDAFKYAEIGRIRRDSMRGTK